MKSLFEILLIVTSSTLLSVSAFAGAVDDCINAIAQNKSCAIKASYTNSGGSCSVDKPCQRLDEICMFGACLNKRDLARQIGPNNSVFASAGEPGYVVLTKLPFKISQAQQSGFIKVAAAKRPRCTEKGSPIQLCWEEEEAAAKRTVCPDADGSPQFCANAGGQEI